MRTINKMVIQPNTPNDNKVLWLNKNNALYYNNGTWVTIGKSSEDVKKLEEKVDSLDGDMQTAEKEIQDINSRHNSLNTKHESLSRTVQGIAATGGASTATNVTYNNDSSRLNAENAQDAIDELQSSKFDKTSILQELGEAEDKAMSQKATSTELNKKADADQVNNSLYQLEQKIGERVVVEGNVTNFPDDEDIASVDNMLKLKDREVDVENFQSKGYVILRKNLHLVNGVVKNILTQDMINQSNTIYEIRYDFDLNNNIIEIKDNCTIKFSNGGTCKNGVLWLHGKNITLCGGTCEAQIKVGLTDEEINQVYNKWFNSNYNIIIKDVKFINKLNQDGVTYMNSLGDSFDYFNSKCAIELKNIIGVNIINCAIIDYEVGIKYLPTANYKQAVSRINILNNVIKHSYCCILARSENSDICNFGDTAISNNELFAVKTCCNISNEDGLLFNNNTLYCIVAQNMGTDNIVINIKDVLNVNISNNQIFAGQIGLKLQGLSNNYTIIQGNNFINSGKLLSELHIPNSYCILCTNYKGALSIVNNSLAPTYANRYIALIDSEFASLTIGENLFKANAETIGKSVGYDATFSIYNPYLAKNIKIANLSKIQDVTIDFKSPLNIKELNRKIVFNIAYEYSGKDTVIINKKRYTFNTVYDEEFLVLFSYKDLKTKNPSKNNTKTMYVVCENKAIKIDINQTDTYEDKFIKINNKLEENNIPSYLDINSCILYVKANGGIRFVNNVSDNGRESVIGVMGGNIVDYANNPLPDTLISSIKNIRNIDFGFINADRYISRYISDEINEKELKIQLIKNNTLPNPGLLIMPYIAIVIARDNTNVLEILKNLYIKGLLKEGITIDNTNTITITRNYNSGILFLLNNSLTYNIIQSPIDFSILSEKYITNIFTFKRLTSHSSLLSENTESISGKYLFLYDKKRPVYYYNNNWYYSDGNDASIKTSGTFAQKPTSDKNIQIGFAYFCTDRKTTEGSNNGIVIYYNGTTWVDSLGREII